MKNGAGEILRESEVSDLVINSLPGVFYLQAQDGRYLKWNKNFEIVSGYSADEIQSLNPLNFFEEKDHAMMIAVIEKVFEEGAAEVEVETITKYGKKVPFYLNGRAVIYEGSRCLIGMGLDITEQVKAKNEIKKKESHLRALLDNMGGAIFLLDTEKRFVIFNNELVKYYNIFRGKAPVPGELSYTFLSPGRLEAKYQLLDRVLDGEKQVVETDFEIHGQRYYFRSWFNPVVVDDKITGISCYVVDISSRKKAEHESQRANERLNYHINNSPLAVIEYDNEMKITFWSKRASDIYGWSEEDVVGKKITEFLVCEEDIVRVTERLQAQEVLERGPLANKNYAKDGKILYTRWYNSQLKDDNDHIETTMSIIRDVTDLWKAELQKEQMANDLVKRNNELEQFTYIVSHNLRSPVASLIGLTQVLSEFELREDERKDIIDGISQSASRLDEVIRDLNDILHLKNNADDKKEKVVFSRLVSEIEQGMERDFYSCKYVIETDFSSVDEHYTLKNYMVSIFSNLISNSIKYRRQEEVPVIKIKSEVDGAKVVLTFNDNGLGFDLKKKQQ